MSKPADASPPRKRRRAAGERAGPAPPGEGEAEPAGRERRGGRKKAQARAEASPFWGWCSVLADYVREFGCPPTTDRVYRGRSLGRWCKRQRESYRRGALRAERAAALEAVPGWCWEPAGIDANRGYALLGRFLRLHGRVPLLAEKFEGFRLGAWCHRHRAAYGRGALAAEWVAALGALPGWAWGPAPGEAGAAPEAPPGQAWSPAHASWLEGILGSD